MFVPTTLNKLSSFQIQVGIPVFVTGGIGGVHRHGEQSKQLHIAYLFCYALTVDTGRNSLYLNCYDLPLSI
jgi:hypothetical protein